MNDVAHIDTTTKTKRMMTSMTTTIGTIIRRPVVPGVS
jgi:hypothetical protein